MVKRIFLFLTVNILVLLTISIVTSLLGISPYLNQVGLDYGSLLVLCAIYGFAGAFISLALSRWMAKFMMGVKVINPNGAQSGAERELVSLVYRLSTGAGLPAKPEVGIYESPEVNAFATGPSKSKSLVAVSTGLLERMDSQAVEGVIGHEIAHIANGDMVTMTLLQGVINTFVMFFARIVAWSISQAGGRDRDDRGGSPLIYYFTVIAFEILFSLLGAIIVNYFSRKREFRADRGGAKLAGKEKMVHALESLKNSVGLMDSGRDGAVATLKISGRSKSVFFKLFSTHPDLDDRIAALKKI